MMILNPYRFAAAGGGTLIEWLSAVGTPRTTTSTSFDVNLPAVNIGDLLVMHIATYWEANINVPSGWNAVAGDVASSGKRSRIFYRTADATAGATTVTVTSSASSQMGAIVNRIKAGTFDGSAPPERAFFGDDNTPPNPPSLSPSWGNKRTLWIAAGANSNGFGNVSVSVWPYADGQTSANAGAAGSAAVSLWSCFVITEAASVNPAAYVMTGEVDNSMAETIAIKPAE